MKELNIINNVDAFFKCTPQTITKLKIYTKKNINLILDNLYKFTNLQSLYLYNNDILEIKGLDKLVKLQQLCLYNTKISAITGLDNLVNLEQLYLAKNKITEIKGLDNLVNLEELYLGGNQITKINGLDNLVKLQKLNLSSNQITEINGLDNLVNLQKLDLSSNQITEIKSLDILVNLLYLSVSGNKITKIKKLDNLVNLEELYLDNNQITEIKGLYNLVNLKYLSLSENKITEIKNIDNLVNLLYININSNQIIELPLSLCTLRNITMIDFNNNPIEYIPLPVERWFEKTDYNNKIYSDEQNVHNHNIQISFRNSLFKLLKDNPTITLETIKQEIIESSILTEVTKREILNYCDDETEHSTYLITYSDLLIYVWSRINNNEEILKVLNQEISDGLCMCFTGRLTRLLNVLAGFYDDIEIQISDSEQISMIITSCQIKYKSKEVKNAVKKELEERNFSKNIINEWLEYV